MPNTASPANVALAALPAIPSVDIVADRALVAEFVGVMIRLTLNGCSWGVDEESPEISAACARADVLAEDLEVAGYAEFVAEMNDWSARYI